MLLFFLLAATKSSDYTNYENDLDYPLISKFSKYAVATFKTLHYLAGENNLSSIIKLYNNFDHNGLNDEQIEIIHIMMISLFDSLKETNNISDLDNMPFNQTAINNTLEFVEEDLRRILDGIKEFAGDIKYLIVNESIQKLTAIHLRNISLEMGEKLLTELVREIDNSIDNFKKYSVSTFLDELYNFVFNYYNATGWIHDVSYFSSLISSQKQLFELDSWQKVFKSIQIQGGVQYFFKFIENLSNEEYLPNLFHEYLNTFKEPLEAIISQLNDLYEYINNSAENIESDQMFTSTLELFNELIGVIEYPIYYTGEVIDNVVAIIESVFDIAFNITKLARFIISGECDEKLFNMIHMICDYVKEEKFSYISLKELINNLKTPFNELKKECDAYIPDFTVLHTIITKPLGVLYELFPQIKNPLIPVIDHALEVFKVYNEFITLILKHAYNNSMSLLMTIIDPMLRFKPIDKIPDFESVSEALISSFAYINSNWDLYNEKFPEIFKEENKVVFTRIINGIILINSSGLNVKDFITNYITHNKTKTNDIIDLLRATLFNQSASINDIYEVLNEKLNISNYISIAKMVATKAIDIFISKNDISNKVLQLIQDYKADSVRIETIITKLDEITNALQKVSSNEMTLLEALPSILTIMDCPEKHNDDITTFINEITNLTLDISNITLFSENTETIEYIKFIINTLVSSYKNTIDKLDDLQFVFDQNNIDGIKNVTNHVIDGLIIIINATTGTSIDVVHVINELSNSLVWDIDFINEILLKIFKLCNLEMNVSIPYIPYISEDEVPEFKLINIFIKSKNIQIPEKIVEMFDEFAPILKYEFLIYTELLEMIFSRNCEFISDELSHTFSFVNTYLSITYDILSTLYQNDMLEKCIKGISKILTGLENKDTTVVLEYSKVIDFLKDVLESVSNSPASDFLSGIEYFHLLIEEISNYTETNIPTEYEQFIVYAEGIFEDKVQYSSLIQKAIEKIEDIHTVFDMIIDAIPVINPKEIWISIINTNDVDIHSSLINIANLDVFCIPLIIKSIVLLNHNEQPAKRMALESESTFNLYDILIVKIQEASNLTIQISNYGQQGIDIVNNFTQQIVGRNLTDSISYIFSFNSTEGVNGLIAKIETGTFEIVYTKASDAINKYSNMTITNIANNVFDKDLTAASNSTSALFDMIANGEAITMTDIKNVINDFINDVPISPTQTPRTSSGNASDSNKILGISTTGFILICIAVVVVICIVIVVTITLIKRRNIEDSSESKNN